MIKSLFGATTMGENQIKFKTDVNLTFNSGSKQRSYVLRTTIHSLSVWKTRNPGVRMTSVRDKNRGISKEAAIIDNEVWVYNVDGSIFQDIVAAVHIASDYYEVSSSTILSDIYAKNLNVESSSKMRNQALIRANQKLYENVCNSIIQAAQQLGITNKLNFYVFSKNNNNKISQKELHEAMRKGGARKVETDVRRHKVLVGSNNGSDFIQQITNFHLAELQV